jgi:diguanylate cyclase
VARAGADYRVIEAGRIQAALSRCRYNGRSVAMGRNSFIALKLRGDQAQFGASLLSVVDRSLSLVRRLLCPDGESDAHQDLRARIDECRAAVASGADPEAIAALAEACFTLCDAAVDGMATAEIDRRTELARLVSLVRDTVTLLAGNGDAFSTEIASAADRFNGLLQIRDVQQLKQALVAEVGQLQRIAASRQNHWRDTVAMFQSRVAALETQLVAVKQQAEVDPLTGISNRRHFETACREYLQLSLRQFVVAIFDLDDFKRINDTGGHPAGDEVLRLVANKLKVGVRKEDSVARIGGDEFALMLAGVTLRQAESRLRSIVAELAALPTALEDPSHVTVSCGAAEYAAGDSIESLMGRADRALYDAKRGGKNRLAVKSPPFIRDLLKR